MILFQIVLKNFLYDKEKGESKKEEKNHIKSK